MAYRMFPAGNGEHQLAFTDIVFAQHGSDAAGMLQQQGVCVTAGLPLSLRIMIIKKQGSILRGDSPQERTGTIRLTSAMFDEVIP